MSKTDTYRQCVLEREFPGSGSRGVLVSWIPAKYAVVGDMLDLRVNGEWRTGFRVVSVGTEFPAAAVEADSRAYRRHRKTTDVPKGTFGGNICKGFE